MMQKDRGPCPGETRSDVEAVDPGADLLAGQDRQAARDLGHGPARVPPPPRPYADQVPIEVVVLDLLYSQETYQDRMRTRRS